MKPETIKDQLQSVEPIRSGQTTVILPYTPGEPIAVKDCKICHKPSPLSQRGRFVCRKCRLIFD